MKKKLANNPFEKFIELQVTEPVKKADPFKKSCFIVIDSANFLRDPQ